MRYIIDHWIWFWNWLLATGATRATVILVFITGFYALLTWRMAKAIARQTRAMIQPVALLEFHWDKEKYYPKGFFEIKNPGTQPLLLLDVSLWCGVDAGRWHFTQHYTLWDEHIVPAGESLQPEFDFTQQLEENRLRWDSHGVSYSLDVVASDVSKQVALTYRNIPVVSIVNVEGGMPSQCVGDIFSNRLDGVTIDLATYLVVEYSRPWDGLALPNAPVARQWNVS